MLPKHLFHAAEYRRSEASRSAKLAPAVGVSLSALRFGCAVVLVCSVASLKLNAQASSNIQDATKTALLSTWNSPARVRHALDALDLLTGGSDAPDLSRQVLVAFNAQDPNTDDREIFETAMGNPDIYNRPTVPGLPNILDILAKANALTEVDEDDLFKCSGPTFYCTEDLIDEIFNARNVPNSGPIVIARINDSFSRKDNYRALYQLLRAYVATATDAGVLAPAYVGRLENLRAAFSINPVRLAKQVAAKVGPAAM